MSVKIKTEDTSRLEDTEVQEIPYEEKIHYVSIIAKPLAPKKVAKKCYKLIKKAKKYQGYLRPGLKTVQKLLRIGETGIVIFAGDVSPVEIMCHLPAVCEEKGIPYVYVPSRKDLGAAMGVKRSCVMVLIKNNSEYEEAFNELKEEINHLGVAL